MGPAHGRFDVLFLISPFCPFSSFRFFLSNKTTRTDQKEETRRTREGRITKNEAAWNCPHRESSRKLLARTNTRESTDWSVKWRENKITKHDTKTKGGRREEKTNGHPCSPSYTHFLVSLLVSRFPPPLALLPFTFARPVAPHFFHPPPPSLLPPFPPSLPSLILPALTLSLSIFFYFCTIPIDYLAFDVFLVSCSRYCLSLVFSVVC